MIPELFFDKHFILTENCRCDTLYPIALKGKKQVCVEYITSSYYSSTIV